MKLKKSTHLAWNILIHSKLRSWLTIIGIVIGIASVVSIVSISLGAQQQVQNQLGNIGADILTVSPGFSRAFFISSGFVGSGGKEVVQMGRGNSLEQSSSSATQKNLTINDINTIKGIQNVEYVMGEISDRETVSYLTKSATLGITGVDASTWKYVTTDTISSGRFLSVGDSNAVVIGQDVATLTFSDIPLNSKLTIDGKTFTVVGILSNGNGIYIPIDQARNMFDVGGKDYQFISVKISDVSEANATVNEITKMLMLERGEIQASQQDFTVSNPAQLQSTIEQTTGMLALFLGAIAAISLIVGAIGIANTMFTSVLEKTREIGIMKAIGTKNKDIMVIFLINAGMIGFVGGLGGVILGAIGSGVIGSLASGAAAGGRGFGRVFGSTALTPALLIGALLFSVIIGMIAGAIPAYRASKLKPVDALRYE
jgi:putative ABC transport system permease protein